MRSVRIGVGRCFSLFVGVELRVYAYLFVKVIMIGWLHDTYTGFDTKKEVNQCLYQKLQPDGLVVQKKGSGRRPGWTLM